MAARDTVEDRAGHLLDHGVVVGAQRLELLGVLLEIGLEAVRVGRLQNLLDRVQRLHHHLPVLVRQLAQQDRTHHRRVQRLARAREARQLVLRRLRTHSLRRAQLLHQLALVAAVRHRRSRLDHGRLVRRGRCHRRRSGLLASEHPGGSRRLLLRLLGSGLRLRLRLRSRSAITAGRLGLLGLGLGLAEGTGSRSRGLRGLGRSRGIATEGTLGTAEPVVLRRGRGARTSANALHTGLGLGGHGGTREGVDGTSGVGAVAETLVEEVVDGLLGSGLDGHVDSIALQRVQRTGEGQTVLDKLVVSTHLSLEINTTIHNQVLKMRTF